MPGRHEGGEVLDADGGERLGAVLLVGAVDPDQAVFAIIPFASSASESSSAPTSRSGIRAGGGVVVLLRNDIMFLKA